MTVKNSDGAWCITINAEIVALADRELLPKALAGDYSAAKYLLWILAGASKKGIPLPPNLGNYLFKGLLSISRHEDAEKAFHIKRKSGRRAKAERDCNIVFFMKRQIHETGMKIEPAKLIAAEKFHLSLDDIHKIWNAYQHSVEMSSDGSGAFVTYEKHKKAPPKKGK